MMFQKAFVDFIQEQGLLAYGDRVLIGLSGGPDSMALCDLLCRMRESWGLFLMAAHLNHSLRPSADAEAQAVAGYCRAQHIPLISAKINVA
ncbi:MAG: ATP-binding protein, partial [Peptococcus niger]